MSIDIYSSADELYYNLKTKIRTNAYIVLKIFEVDIMEMLGIILLAISLSVDAFGIGLSYSLRKVKIPLIPKLIISLISVLITAVSFLFGNAILLFISENVAKLIGCVMLIILGALTIFKGLRENGNDEEPKKNDVISFFIKPLQVTVKIIKEHKKSNADSSKRVDVFESIYLGLSLSVDSLVVGVTYAIIGSLSFFVPIYVGIGQFAFLSLGAILGAKISKAKNINSKVFVFISGAILIILAIVRMF